MLNLVQKEVNKVQFAWYRLWIMPNFNASTKFTIQIWEKKIQKL